VDGDLLEDAAQVDEHVEAGGTAASLARRRTAATPARRRTAAAARPSHRRRRRRRRCLRRLLLACKELLEDGSFIRGGLYEVRASVLYEDPLVLTLEGRETRLGVGSG